MGRRLGGAVVVALVVTGGIWSGVFDTPADAQASRIARTADRKPDLSGVWQAMNTANWDLQDHAAQKGPILALGAAFSIPGGRGIVEGNEIPYKPEALAKKKENGKNWVTMDPEVKCFLPGTPRAMYQPYPFQIVQTPRHILMAFEFAGTTRTLYVGAKDDKAMAEAETPVPSWMGWSRARWEGDTLVVDVTDFNDQSWFDRAGNFHSDEMTITERYTMTDPNVIRYEATITDPQTFTRPWKISMPLYRRLEKYPETFEYKCVEFVEDLIYGQYYKTPIVVK